MFATLLKVFILLEDSIKRSKNFDEIVEKDLKDLPSKRGPYSELFCSVFPAFTLNAFALNSVRMWENGDQNKSEYGKISRSNFCIKNCREFDDLEEIRN